jgi:signal transduction histidine kinase
MASRRRIPHWFASGAGGESDRGAYAFLVYCVALPIGTFYLLKFNFEYHLSHYTFVFGPFLLVLALWPFLAKALRKPEWTAAGLWITLCLLSATMIGVSGGLRAPGLFWLAAIPITGAILFPQRGMSLGMTYVALVLAAYFFLGRRELLPTDVMQIMNYNKEQLTNLATFCFYLLLTVQYYVRNENRLQRELAASRGETENLLRVLVHDFANSVTRIQLSLDILKRDFAIVDCEKSQPCGFDGLEGIVFATEAATAILGKIRQFNALKDGKLHLQPTLLDLKELLKRVAQNYSRECAEKKIELALLHKEEQVHVQGDEIILSVVVLSNLLSNAIKFSHSGGRVEIHLSRAGDKARIEIRDYGIGIPENILSSLFTLGTPTTRTGTAGEKGTGYGMPLVKSYLEKMGGEIHVKSRTTETDSAVPPGTSVLLELPLA